MQLREKSAPLPWKPVVVPWPPIALIAPKASLPFWRNANPNLSGDDRMNDLTINSAIDFTLPPAFVGRHLIDGEWVEGASTFDRTSPSHGHVVSVSAKGENIDVRTKGRHDPCVGIRAVPIAEAMVTCAIVDHWLLHRGQTGRV